MAGEVRAGTVRIDVAGNSSRFTRTLRQSGESVRAYGRRVKRLERQSRALNRAVRSGINRLSSYRSVVAGLAVGGALAYIVRQQAGLGAAIQETSEQLGISAERWQVLGQIFEADGTTSERLRRSVTQLNRAVVEAARGSETYARAFRVLGIDAREFIASGRDSYDLLRQIASQIQTVESQTVRQGIFADLFGTRAGGALLVTLQRGTQAYDAQAASARRVGVVTDANSAALKGLDQSFTDLANRLRTSVQNAIGENAERLERLLDLIGDRAPAAVETGARAVTFLGDNFGLLARGLAAAIGIRAGTGLLQFLTLIAAAPAGVITAAGSLGVFAGGVLIAGNAIAEVLRIIELAGPSDASIRDRYAATLNRLTDPTAVNVQTEAIRRLENEYGSIQRVLEEVDDPDSGTFRAAALRADEISARLRRLREGPQPFTPPPEAPEFARPPPIDPALYTKPAAEVIAAHHRAALTITNTYEIAQARLAVLIQAARVQAAAAREELLITDVPTSEFARRAVVDIENSIADAQARQNAELGESIRRAERFNGAIRQTADTAGEMLLTFIRAGNSLGDAVRQARDLAAALAADLFRQLILQPVSDAIAARISPIPERQHGGPAFGPTIVGEHERELAIFRQPAQVYSGADTRRILGNQGGGLTFAPVIQTSDRAAIRQGLAEAVRELRILFARDLVAFRTQDSSVSRLIPRF